MPQWVTRAWCVSAMHELVHHTTNTCPASPCSSKANARAPSQSLTRSSPLFARPLMLLQLVSALRHGHRHRTPWQPLFPGLWAPPAPPRVSPPPPLPPTTPDAPRPSHRPPEDRCHQHSRWWAAALHGPASSGHLETSHGHPRVHAGLLLLPPPLPYRWRAPSGRHRELWQPPLFQFTSGTSRSNLIKGRGLSTHPQTHMNSSIKDLFVLFCCNFGNS
jgi:hypothetical protein